MAVFNLYSKRKKLREEGQVDVFSYNQITPTLRIQIIQILKEAFGDYRGYSSLPSDPWKSIHEILAREYGQFSLGETHEGDFAAVANSFLSTTSIDKALDFIELAFKHVDALDRDWQFKQIARPQITAIEAIEELNERFLENAVGYEYVAGVIIRKDNEVLHKEVIVPALTLLHEKAFRGANEEYLSAHEHYRNGRTKECLNDCLKAFESTMKTICKIKGWSYDNNDTAKSLIDVCFKNDLVPRFLQNEVGALRAALEGGIPTVRNRLSGHGQGETPIEVPVYYASYLLNLTAATITLLINAAGSK